MFPCNRVPVGIKKNKVRKIKHSVCDIATICKYLYTHKVMQRGTQGDALLRTVPHMLQIMVLPNRSFYTSPHRSCVISVLYISTRLEQQKIDL